MSTALDAALTAVNACLANATDQQQLVGAKVRGLLRGYDARWADAPYVPVVVEKVLEGELHNLSNEKRISTSRTFRIAGKLDVICEYHGKRFVFDAKTTSEDIADPDSPYWRQLIVEAQPTHYLLLCWLNGIKADGAVWDCVKKPNIRPRQLKPAELKSVVSDNPWFNEKVSEVDRNNLIAESATDRTPIESLAMYESRLAWDCTEVRPQYYFQRRQLPRLDQEIHQYSRELWDMAQDVLACRNTGRNYKSPEACMAWGRPCTFLGVCSGYDTIESDRWTRREWPHNELPVLQGDVLTNSRLRVFRQCHLKHYYSYELGLERVDEDERESIYTGNLWHVALEAWWKSFMKESDHEHGHDSQVNTACEPTGARQTTLSL